MREINKFFKIIIFIFFCLVVHAESKALSIGNTNAKVIVKVFSSLTCPHCADFHSLIFNDLKKDYIDKGLVRFEHHAFPRWQLNVELLDVSLIMTKNLNYLRPFIK